MPVHSGDDSNGPPRNDPARASVTVRACWGVLLVATTLAAYFPALNGSQVWDDDAWLQNIDHLKQNLHGLWRIWTEPTAMQQYYPVAGTSFWLDHQLWGANTLPMHAENVLLHAASSLLLWRLLQRWRVPGAWLAAWVFALHPVMVESVAWITERKNVLSLVLTLAAFLAWERWQDRRTRPGYALVVLLCLGALLAKITAFVIAPTLLLVAWWRHGTIRWRRDVVPAFPLFLITFVLGAAIWWLETHHVGAEGREFAMSFDRRLASAGRAAWFYPGKLLWPANLCFVYPDWRGNAPSWLDWSWLGAVLAVLAVFWLGRDRMGRGPVTAVFFYLGALLPVSGLTNAYGGLFSPVWDHWAYVPGIAIIVLACAGVAMLAQKLAWPWLTVAFAALVLPVLSVQTWRQAGQYRDKATLWLETLARNPACWLAHNNYGVMLADAGKLDQALDHYEAALALRPEFPNALSNKAFNLLQRGRVAESVALYEKAVALEPDSANFVNGLGNALLMAGEWARAAEAFEQSLRRDPDYAVAHNSLAVALLKLDRRDEALQHIRRAIELDPKYYQAHNNLGSALEKQDDLDGALAAYREAVELKPDFAEAHFNIAEALFKKGDVEGAVAAFAQTAKLDPKHSQARYSLGVAFDKQGRLPDAIAAYEQAIAIRPDYANAHNNLGNDLLKLGRVAEALPHFQKAIDADANQLAALNNLAWVLATDTNASLRDGKRAVDLAIRAAELVQHHHPSVLMTLSAAHAEAGQFEDAIRTAREALDLANAQGNQSLMANLQSYIAGYQSRQPVRVERRPQP